MRVIFFYTKRGKLYVDLLRHILNNDKCKTGKANYAHENLSFSDKARSLLA